MTYNWATWLDNGGGQNLYELKVAISTLVGALLFTVLFGEPVIVGIWVAWALSWVGWRFWRTKQRKARADRRRSRFVDPDRFQNQLDFSAYLQSSEGRRRSKILSKLGTVSDKAQRLSDLAKTFASFGQETDELSKDVGWHHLKGCCMEDAQAQGTAMAVQLLGSEITASAIVKQARQLDFPDLARFLFGLSERIREAQSEAAHPDAPIGPLETSLPEITALSPALEEIQKDWQSLTWSVVIEATEQAIENGMDIAQAADRQVGLFHLYRRSFRGHSWDLLREKAKAGDLASTVILFKHYMRGGLAPLDDTETFYFHENATVRQLVRTLAKKALSNVDDRDPESIRYCGDLQDLLTRLDFEEKRRGADKN